MATPNDMTVDYRDDAWITTQSGVEFNIDRPEFRLDDIAHALSMCARYNGHTNDFYSIAEHSLNVAALMEHLGYDNPAEGLMHDASEAYLTDVPAPFKQYLPDWRGMDKGLELKMREHFGIGPHTTECKHADRLSLFIEANDLLPYNGARFADPQGLRRGAIDLARRHMEFRPLCLGWRVAKEAFMEKAEYYNIKGA